MSQTNPSIRICDKCKGGCQPLITPRIPACSEWYCAVCHKSYDMPEDHYAFWVSRKRPQKEAHHG